MAIEAGMAGLALLASGVMTISIGFGNTRAAASDDGERQARLVVGSSFKTLGFMQAALGAGFLISWAISLFTRPGGF